MSHSGLTKKAEPPPTRDVNRDSGTDSANGGWLRRLVRPIHLPTNADTIAPRMAPMMPLISHSRNLFDSELLFEISRCISSTNSVSRLSEASAPPPVNRRSISLGGYATVVSQIGRASC